VQATAVPHQSRTIRQWLEHAIPALSRSGIETARTDAELLLAHSLEQSRTFLYAHPDEPLTCASRVADELLAARSRRVPLPYLLGRWEFLGLSFRVTPAVLIPRPETELLVEAAVARLPAADARVLDVGAGSGCVGIGIAHLAPATRVTCLEVSPDSVAVARENAHELGVSSRVAVVQGCFPTCISSLPRYQAVVSNPPYIPREEIEHLATEQHVHEPRQALDGGPDGLKVIRDLVRFAPTLLEPGGLMAVEVGFGQAPLVTALIEAEPQWEEIEVVSDLAGIQRVVLTRFKG
jgi:release factor glutamine methyltransferase